MTIRSLNCAFLLALPVLLAGCGGGSGGGYSDSTPPPSAPPPPPPPSLQATFSSIQTNVFTPQCTGCHVGSLAPEGLQLDSANSYGLLVDVASSQEPSLLRVDPGNPNDSYLIHKLEGTAEMCCRMPLDAPPLPTATIQTIRQWITDGALDDRATGIATKPIRASGSSIVPNSIIGELPETIIVMFDRELDFSTVNLASVSLSRSGGNGAFGDDSEVPVAISHVSLSLLNPRALTVHLSGTQGVADTYRLVLSGSEPNPIQDIEGNLLDGTWTQTFPSGDGNPGGDLHIEFTVAGSNE